jgi:hydroxymethylpyrimidine pyrophosphatase-like HAD family hydrolase
MTPSVVATDLDGTLVHSDGTISDRTRAALAAAADAGALIVIATGRPPRWLPGVADATGHHGIAICANGALVYDLASEQIVRSRPLDPEVARHLMSLLRKAVPDIEFGVELVDGGFAHEPGYRPRWTPKPGAYVGELDDRLTGPISKLLGRREGMGSDELLGIARTEVGDSIATMTHSSIDGLLEISALGVTKASTLAELVAQRGLGPADVVAFGDMPNDVEMLRWAGLGVAVANAHPEVLAVVDEVTASNNDDGVAQVLERLFGTTPVSAQR